MSTMLLPTSLPVGVPGTAPDIPSYLTDPRVPAPHYYGTLAYEERAHAVGRYVITGEPAALEMAKRVFPGCVSVRKERVHFAATRRAVGELNWYLLRYPMRFDASVVARFAADREQAIAHALRRDELRTLAPLDTPPTFRGTLVPFQAEDVAQMVANQRSLLAWPMGSGKSPGGLAGLAAAHAFPALLVIPPNLIPQWPRVIGRFLDLPTPADAATQGELPLSDPESDEARDARTERMVHVIRGLKPYELPNKPIHVIHYGLLRGWRDVLPTYGYRGVLFDEIHELRHVGTEKYSVASLISAACEYAFGLSGTPIYNYGAEIWAVLNALEYHCLGDRDAFTREWCVGYGADRVADPPLLGTHLRREGLMLRREKEETQKDLPPKRRIVQVIGKDDQAYRRLVSEAVKLAKGYDDITSWQLKGQTKRSIDEMARRATGIAKAPEAALFIQGLLAAGERVLVYAHHHDVHDILMDALADAKPAKMTGTESIAEKDRAFQRFVRGETDLALLALRSSAGLDGLQERATVVVFVELDYSPAVHAQCEDRGHRSGLAASLASFLCYYLVTDSGSDETVLDALGMKTEQFIGLMGDRPESEADRALAQSAADEHMDRLIQLLKAA